MKESIPTYGNKKNTDYSSWLGLDENKSLTEPEEKIKSKVFDDNISLEQIQADDSYQIAKGLLKNKYYSNEEWDKTINIPAIIVDMEESSVIVECLIDQNKNTYQIRRFDKYLFDEFENLNIKDTFLIKIRTKAGSFRIDIYNGKDIVQKSLFDYNGDWNGIDNSLSKSLSDADEINL